MTSSLKPIRRSGILPWSHSCFVCGQDNPHGLRLKCRLEDGRPVLDYTPSARDLGWRHLVHGGITITLLDEVMTWAAIIGARKPCVAAEVNSRLKRPVPAGRPLRIEAGIECVKSRLVCTTARMTDLNGDELATATGKYMLMDGNQAVFCAEDFVEDPNEITFAEIFGS